jgi:predicted phage-related endonuclease
MPKHGTITPSQFKKIMTKGRGKDAVFGQTAHTYADEIVLDLLGVEREQITAAALEHGNELEPFARERYESEQFASVQIVNEPIVHPEFDFVAGTPDGLIGDDGIIEIKCPFNPVNHLKNIESAAQLDLYFYQIQGYLWITGRKWCDFVSYDIRFPDELQIAVHRVERDDAIILQLQQRCLLFWDLIQQKLENIRK